MSNSDTYDLIVVGGGHAGCEAAAAAANLGSRVLMVTMNLNAIGQMSCNPAMGGVAKGQIVREIDAMGGYSGIVTDKSMVQFRMLNRSKGPAMWSPRSQNDRDLFAKEWRQILEGIPNVHFLQEMVSSLITEEDSDGVKVVGVNTSMGTTINARSVVLTSGTFMNGLMHIGEKQVGGGRAGEKASVGITEQLVGLGFESGRMKTGTPPRVDGRSIDYSILEPQPGDENPSKFSFSEATSPPTSQLQCHITYTSPEVHDILRSGFDQSPMFNGRIRGVGPRYCPSIEDKIDRFADKDRHQIFVEPEGWDTVETYINGFSTSLPQEVQVAALQKVPGFANARLFRPGYAVEYDYFPPTQLQQTMETKLVSGLYFAGQINGTTGYEEAACQGLMAGINAHLKIQDKDPFTLGRDEAYIGVLIDDLITKGTDEPYRMFTSRAEFRILLRQDNADLRLTQLSHKLGLASDERIKRVEEKIAGTSELTAMLSSAKVDPPSANAVIVPRGTSPLKERSDLLSLLRRPQLQYSDLNDLSPDLNTTTTRLGAIAPEVIEQVEIGVKYEGYLEKERAIAEKLQRLDDVPLDPEMDFSKLHSLSHEAKEKLTHVRPTTLGQASRISGITPSDLSVLMVYIGR